MSILAKRRLAGFTIAGAIFALDQCAKWAVAGPLRLVNQGDSLTVLPIFAFTRTHNYGVSLGLFTAQSTEMQLALIAVTGLIALAVAIWMMRETAFGDIAALGLVLGGALGNIVDRTRLGYVLDYADLHIGSFRPFLVFNVADAAITIGVLIVLARSLFMREKPAEPQSPDNPDEPAQGAAETH
jgi:signal peptidase II